MRSGRWMKTRIHFRATAYFVSRRGNRTYARAHPISEADSFSRRCNSINSFVRWYRSPRRGEQCYGCRAFLHRVRIALGVTTRGCGTTASDTFPCRRRRINRCSRKKGSGKGDIKRGSESSAMAKRYISNAIVIGVAPRCIVDSARTSAHENLRTGEKLCVSNYAIRY